jgi:lipoprotein-releasing system ATP-binding protein
MHKRANKVSGGQAQRAAIARGLVNRPTIVLADEPTGNLDSVTAETIVELMKSMAKKLNQTFIIVTHDRHQFGQVDRVITIKDGRAFEGEDMPPQMELTT